MEAVKDIALEKQLEKIMELLFAKGFEDYDKNTWELWDESHSHNYIIVCVPEDPNKFPKFRCYFSRFDRTAYLTADELIQGLGYLRDYWD